MSEVKAKKEGGLNFSVKSYLGALAVIFLLMIATYVLTLVIPGGAYDRDSAGELVEGSFHAVAGGIPFWKWLLSPFLVLGGTGNGLLIAIIIFLLVIGGVFNALGEYGLMRYMLGAIVKKYTASRYTLLAVIPLFFMAMGSLIGSFEECVPMVPIVVALAVSLGWDALTGVGMSLLAVGCGFASGVCNPFSVGVAQELAGLPMFSGIWLRALAFGCIYPLLWLFLRHHAKKIERPVDSALTDTHHSSPAMSKGLWCFGISVGTGILLVLLSGIIPALQDYTMIIIALAFLVGGISATLAAGMPGRELARSFGSGVVGILPAVLMILMASSIRYTLDTAHVLDTVLYRSVGLAQVLPGWAVILFIYLIVLVMNFFIGSGSAKAFMLIPLIVPLAQQFGISAQLCIVAFAFGDGFSNVFYPTNAALLISLGLADMSYGKWARWSWKFQAMNLLLTCGILLLGLWVGY